jgi:hypothetical protein
MPLSMNPKIPRLFAAASLACFASVAVAQDHGHLNVGAAGKNQNDPLVFDGSEIFETTSGYVKTLIYTNSGRYAGYYQGNITLTGLSATTGHPAYATNAAAPGSWLFAELASLDGPPGGQFAFWENGATNPTIGLVSGATGTNVWRLTEADGSPGSDPYGHFHGRRFTATLPGIYVVGFRARDLSTNGAGGGPIHAPSQELKVYFQAGDNIRSIESRTNSIHVRFGARLGYSWQLQAASNLATNDWVAVGDAVTGDDYFHEVTDEDPIVRECYYRIEGTAIEP